MDMSSEGLGEMFEGNFADTCAEKNHRWCRWGADLRVKRAQTRERGPPSAPGEILLIVLYQVDLAYISIYAMPNIWKSDLLKVQVKIKYFCFRLHITKICEGNF